MQSSDNETGRFTGGCILEIAAEICSARSRGDEAWLRGQWALAAREFASVDRPDGATEMRRRLAANLAGLREFRPALYDMLIAPSEDSRYRPCRAKYGRMTIGIQQQSGEVESLSSRNDPVAQVMHLLPRIPGGQSVALCGLGDGWLLSALVDMDRTDDCIIIEPDAYLLLTALAVHDYSQDSGPIRQTRFTWLIGADWSKGMKTIRPATIKIAQGPDGTNIEAALIAFQGDSCV